MKIKTKRRVADVVLFIALFSMFILVDYFFLSEEFSWGTIITALCVASSIFVVPFLQKKFSAKA